MKFRQAIEIGENVVMNPPFLPKLQVGQHVKVFGNPGRFVGVSPGGIIWIVWPKTCGRKYVDNAIKLQNEALKNMQRLAILKAAAREAKS